MAGFIRLLLPEWDVGSNSALGKVPIGNDAELLLTAIF